MTVTRPDVVVFGDSTLGHSADGTGKLGKALVPLLVEWGYADSPEAVEVLGVGGSTAGTWLYTAGLRKGFRGLQPWRWDTRHKAAMPQDAIERANLERIGQLDAPIYWINLSANDAWGNKPEHFIASARKVLSYLPKSAKVVWSEGQGLTGRTHPYDRKRANMDALARAFAGSRRVLVLTAGDEASLKAYHRKNIHPDVAEHTAWLNLKAPRILAHLDAPRPKGNGLVVAAVGVVGATFAYAAWQWARNTGRL